MFKDVENRIIGQIDEFCLQNELPTGKIEFRSIPFSGEWGMAAPLFPLAAADQNKTGPVPQHAQHLAEKIKEVIGLPEGFTRSEAIRGYLNFYFDTGLYATSVVEQIRQQGKDFGNFAPTGQTVMVEYSNPNTHKPLHVGHLRNVILGGTVCNILEASGKKVIRANYIGDI
ncbi:MAG: arginine--tRNA ligase, partial [Anaerolineaceae bacterium]